MSQVGTSPRPSRRPLLSAVVVLREKDTQAAGQAALAALGDDLTEARTELVAVLPGADQALVKGVREHLLKARGNASVQVVRAPENDIGRGLAHAVRAASGRSVLLLDGPAGVPADLVRSARRHSRRETVVAARVPVAARPADTLTLLSDGAVVPRELLSRWDPRDKEIADAASFVTVAVLDALSSYRYQLVPVTDGLALPDRTHPRVSLLTVARAVLRWQARVGPVDEQLVARHSTLPTQLVAAAISVLLEAAPQEAEDVARQLDGIPASRDLVRRLRGTGSSPALDRFFRPEAGNPFALTVLAAEIRDARRVAHELRYLDLSGVTVRVVVPAGDRGKILGRHTILVDDTDGPGVRAAIAAADRVVSTSATSAAAYQHLTRTSQVGVEHVRDLVVLRTGTGRVVPSSNAGEVFGKAFQARGEQAPVDDPWAWPVMTARQVMAGRAELARQVLATARRRIPPEQHQQLGLEGLTAWVDAWEHDATGLARTADVCLDEADRWLDRGDLDAALFLYFVALRLLFEPMHHSSVAATPLVSTPEQHLGRLRRSSTHAYLRARVVDAPRLSRAGSSRPGTAVVLTGAYPRFWPILVEGLQDRWERVEPLAIGGTGTRYQSTETDPLTIGSISDGAHLRPLVSSTLREADLVVADWADKGFLETCQRLPEGTRLVTRIHGVDTLTPWVHLADWSRVEAVIAPSAHVAAALRTVVGDVLGSTPIHIVPNPVDVDRFTTDKEPEARWTLGLIGWAQRVKDPTFAVELLSLLRRHDDRWTLRLIGADLAPVNRRSETEHAAAFRRRALQPDVRDAIDYVSYTSDLPGAARRIGWALSTSVRESFHIGLMELAASGAVPLVRNWPLYRDLGGGAASVVPASWVVETPQEAAERILQLDDQSWRTAGLEASAHMGRLASRRKVRSQLAEILAPGQELDHE